MFEIKIKSRLQVLVIQDLNDNTGRERQERLYDKVTDERKIKAGSSHTIKGSFIQMLKLPRIMNHVREEVYARRKILQGIIKMT